MNKKLLALLLIAVMLFAVGCSNDVDTEETTLPSQSMQAETNPEITDETIPGVISLEKPLINPFDEMEDAEQETTENNGFIDNTDNNSGGNGQSDTGNNNTGNGSSQGSSNNNGNANGSSNTGNGSSQGGSNNNGNANGSSNSGNGSSQGGSNNNGNANGSGNSGNGSSQGGSNNNGNANGSGNSGNGSSQGSSNSNGNTTGSNTEKPTLSGGETATDPQPTKPSSEIDYVSYEEYNNMPPAEQVAYYNQFSSMEAFVKWYNEAKAAHDAEHGSVDVGDGNIDLGDFVNP